MNLNVFNLCLEFVGHKFYLTNGDLCKRNLVQKDQANATKTSSTFLFGNISSIQSVTKEKEKMRKRSDQEHFAIRSVNDFIKTLVNPNGDFKV